VKESEKEKLAQFKTTLPKQKNSRRVTRKRWRGRRALSPTERALVEQSPHRRGRLEGQGSRPAASGEQLPPGLVYSVELARCGHRARVETLTSGHVPRRAKCPRCGRWRDTRPETAREPAPSATRTVIEERVEQRDGREYVVKVLATPRRARGGD
jgi:hypothetical protein